VRSRSRHWATFGIVAALVGAGSAASAATGASDSSAAPVHSLTVGITTDVDSLNPFTGIVLESFEMYQLMYPTLTTNSAADLAPVGDLAESWEESADQRTWTYHLREGVRWSDGVPLTAEDAAYSFNRVIDGDYERTNYGSFVENITRATAPDESTVVLSVKAPTPLMDALGVYILPKHIWSAIDSSQVRKYTNEPAAGQPVIGAGPYLLAERAKGQFLRFVANRDYWRGAPAFEELVYRVYENDDSLAQALRKGEVDFAHDLPATVFDALADEASLTTLEATNSDFSQIAMNTGAALTDGTAIGDGNPALRDQRVRQAINYAIDRGRLVERVLAGHGSAATTVIPPLYPNLHLTPEDPYTFDPERAGALLDAAGYPRADDGRRADVSGAPLTLRLLGRQESPESQRSVQFVQGWLEDLGVTVKTRIVSEDSLIEIVGQGNFDLFEWGWGVDPDPDYQLSTFTCDQRSTKEGSTIYAGLSDSFFCDASYDKLYSAQAVETDPQKRAGIVREMQQILYDQAPYALTYYPNMLQARRTDAAHGFVNQPTRGADGLPGRELFQLGTWSLDSIQPGAATDSAADAEPASTGSPALWLIGAAISSALLVLAMRRRRADEDVE
jgi:peptide/nickel transport system substrate-binding protein